jgi:8-oxo-dGTP pyrophosphatase MutT (NUDIX family)
MAGWNIANLLTDIKDTLKAPLPGKDAQARMISNFQREKIKYFNNNEFLRKAAVLIILFEENSRLKTLFIERMPDPGPHSGQIAFPGGRMEEADKDLIETAIREAEEEIDVVVERKNILGQLTPVEIPVSGFSVLPVMGYIEFIPKTNRCPREVKCILNVDLWKLFESKTSKVINVRGENIEVPCYIVDEHVIWGATAMVLSELEEVLKKVHISH